MNLNLDIKKSEIMEVSGIIKKVIPIEVTECYPAYVSMIDNMPDKTASLMRFGDLLIMFTTDYTMIEEFKYYEKYEPFHVFVGGKNKYVIEKDNTLGEDATLLRMDFFKHIHEFNEKRRYEEWMLKMIGQLLGETDDKG